MKGRTTWRVKRVGKLGRYPVNVVADYHVIEGGALKFRNSERGTYPVNVMAFAHGQWVSVENLSIPVEEP